MKATVESKKKRKSSDEKGDENSTAAIAAATINKKQKLSEELLQVVTIETRPRSKKELRKERQAVEKAGKEVTPKQTKDPLEGAKRLGKAEYSKQKQERKKVELRLERKAQNEARKKVQEARAQEQDDLRREKMLEAAATAKAAKGKKKLNKCERAAVKSNAKEAVKSSEKDGRDHAIFKSLFQKQQDPTTGATLCRLGVKYIDTKVGVGPPARSGCLVTVKYQLRGGTPNGVLLDSSKKFLFRLGKGEVIQGWDIGLEGMQIGSIRNLIVPPKAGYASQDIGAGSGAMLYFTVTLLAVRPREQSEGQEVVPSNRSQRKNNLCT